MSRTAPNSPIQRLDFDLLWYIVSMNADMFNDKRALETTLATSRVCRGWRTFMLSMPSIWAHLIDLDRLHWRTVEFRREMIRRSGTAFLWVKARRCVGHHLDDPVRCMKYVLDALDENWGRFQRIDANIVMEHVGFDEWAPLCRPSPHLESLNLVFEHPEQYYRRPTLSLLGGDAPMLRTLVLNAKLTTTEVLAILMQTPDLVTLKLEKTVNIQKTPVQRHVTLARLSHLSIGVIDNPSAGLILLCCMHIPITCTLSFSAQAVPPRSIAASPNLLRSVLTIISHCARHLFAYHAPHKVHLVYSEEHFELRVSSRSGEPVFEFKIELVDSEPWPPYALPSFLGSFALPCFSEVAEFDFGLVGVHDPVPAFTEFALCLPAVQVIDTDTLSVRHLARAQEALQACPEPAVVFPALKTLIVSLSLLLPRLSDLDCDPVSEFIMMRIAHGYPVDIVDITRFTPVTMLPDVMVFLREATGLKVLWQQSRYGEILEYICGPTSMSQNVLSS